MRFFHSQALICFSPVKLLTTVRRLLEVLVDDEPHSRLFAVSDLFSALGLIFSELATRLAFLIVAPSAC
jgi:hypothetical protein